MAEDWARWSNGFAVIVIGPNRGHRRAGGLDDVERALSEESVLLEISLGPVPGRLSRRRIRLQSDPGQVLHFTLYLRPGYRLASPTDLGVRLRFGPESSAFWHRIWRLGAI